MSIIICDTINYYDKFNEGKEFFAHLKYSGVDILTYPHWVDKYGSRYYLQIKASLLDMLQIDHCYVFKLKYGKCYNEEAMILEVIYDTTLKTPL